MSITASPFGTILVPLDGSARAERALPAAARLAQATHSTLLLARVVPLTTPAAILAAEGVYTDPDVYQQLRDGDEHAAATYLEQQAAPLRKRGVDVLARTCVRSGEVTGCLLAIEREEQVGLVVMTTHGRTGVARLALGSVADRLVRQGQVPVLLLRSLDGEAQEPPLARAVVPLDGSARAEQSLVIALRLAGAVLQQAQAVRVVETADATQQIAEAHQYLDAITGQWTPLFAERGATFTARVRIGAPAEQIIQQVTVDGDLIVLATHGRSGLVRLTLGSVADQLLRDSAAPLLLVRAGTSVD